MMRGVDALLDRLTIRERPGKQAFRFWQEGSGYDRNLSSPKLIESVIDYIHFNPVRRELCEYLVRTNMAYYFMRDEKFVGWYVIRRSQLQVGLNKKRSWKNIQRKQCFARAIPG